MLFSLTGTYPPHALSAMRTNASASSRHESTDRLFTAAGGKLLSFYFTIGDGPGILAIIEADPIAMAAIAGTAVEVGGMLNAKVSRLYTEQEAAAISQRRAQIAESYKPPGH